MPISKTKNEDFFKCWSSEMAYVLGFIAADGSIIKNKRGAHFLEVETIDKGLLESIRKLIGSNHKIGIRKRSVSWQVSYRLQVGSKVMFDDLVDLGLTQNKAKRLRIPDVPKKYLAHFVRGYFDGDGSVSFCEKYKYNRKNCSRFIITRFVSSSEGMLNDIGTIIHDIAKARLKKPVPRQDNSFQLQYSTNDSRKIYRFLYSKKDNIFLERKKIVFERYLKINPICSIQSGPVA